MTGRDENDSEVRRAWRLVETQYIESRISTLNVSLVASASNQCCQYEQSDIPPNCTNDAGSRPPMALSVPRLQAHSCLAKIHVTTAIYIRLQGLVHDNHPLLAADPTLFRPHDARCAMHVGVDHNFMQVLST